MNPGCEGRKEWGTAGGGTEFRRPGERVPLGAGPAYLVSRIESISFLSNFL